MPSLRIAYDLEAYLSGAGNAGWLLQPVEVRELNIELIKKQALLLRSLSSDHHAGIILGLATKGLHVLSLTFCIALWTVERARRSNVEIVFQAPSIASEFWHYGRARHLSEFRVKSRRQLEVEHSPIWKRTAARFIRSAKFSGRLGWPIPTRTGVLNRNGLLEQSMRVKPDGGFHMIMPRDILRGSDKDVGRGLSQALAGVAEQITAMVSDCLEFREVMMSQYVVLDFKREVVAWLEMVAKDWACVQAWHPPKVLWGGTGGNYVTRLARAAVREASGTSVGFEHGGGGHIHDESAPLHMQEYAFVDQFVVDTPYKATVLQQRIQSDLLVDPAGQIPEIVSCESNTYRKSHDSPTYYGTQPRVLYVTTAFVGETQYPLQPLMPDQLYADWQNRLVRQVQALGFQIACKSHPEGIMKGSMPHLEGVCPLLGGRFIDHVRDYDVFLFDYPATSTLWEACLTNRKIVFVDLGLAQWVPEIWADFSQRCSIVTAEYDEFGRPIVKSEALQKGLNSPFGGGAFVDRNLLGSLE